ncbi:hypothetical protein EMGBD4_16530 [Verrucomicrobiota bacterium]|nr:hypothetical protein EMGBD4_16530 [Verrucomicrobiota bacterium]
MKLHHGGLRPDVVANIKQVCEESGITVPDIVSESGRALVARTPS